MISVNIIGKFCHFSSLSTEKWKLGASKDGNAIVYLELYFSIVSAITYQRVIWPLRARNEYVISLELAHVGLISPLIWPDFDVVITTFLGSLLFKARSGTPPQNPYTSHHLKSWWGDGLYRSFPYVEKMALTI